MTDERKVTEVFIEPDRTRCSECRKKLVPCVVVDAPPRSPATAYFCPTPACWHYVNLTGNRTWRKA